MKTVWVLATMLIGLIGPASWAQPGLKGEYYNGINFEKKVGTRIDPKISFDWRGRSPAAGMGQSYFSVRWTGKLLAPVSGKYVFSAMVDDGVRIWVNNKKIVDEWALHDDVGVRGEIVLEAGTYYDLRVEYFNEKLEGLIMLFWQRPDEPIVLNPNGERGQANGSQTIGGQYFFRTAPPVPKPVVVPPKPKPVVAAVVPKPTPAPKPVPVSVAASIPKPVAATAVAPVSNTPAAPEKKAVNSTFGTLETGKSLVLENVFFEQSSYVLLPASFAELDKLVLVLRQNPAVRIEIAGHTDNVGDARLNQSLSEFRARVVKNYLNRQGIAEDRVDAKGYGGSRPLNGNNTESERARNRRVEFLVK